MAVPVLACLFGTGCLPPLAPADVQRLRDDQRTHLRVYRHPDATPTIRAYSRVGYCLIDATLRSAHAPTVDSKGAINCEVRK